MANLVEETRNIMKKYGIRANKDLGQNFLINNEVVENIVNSSEISQDDMVIEIGPGLGTLTKYLLEKAGKVLCIELDKKMIEILEDRFEEYSNFEIINDDVLKVDLNKIIKENKENEKIKNVKIVANLPYYITTPIIMKLLEEKLDIESITVPNSSFIPEPEVTSEVIKMKIRKEPVVKVENPKVMFMIIKSAFMQRRKTLLNALTNAQVFISKQEGIKILNKLGLNENVRAENLTIENYADLAKEISK